jgi:hypothetical protein
LLYLQNLLAEDGRWGVMQAQRWDAFLDWLSGEQGSCSMSAPAVAAAAVIAADATAFSRLLQPWCRNRLFCRQWAADDQGAEPGGKGEQQHSHAPAVSALLLPLRSLLKCSLSLCSCNATHRRPA